MVWFLYSAFPLKALYTTWLIYPITPIPTSTFSARSAFQLHSHTFIKCAKLILKTNGEVHEGYAFERGASFFLKLIVFSKTLEDHEARLLEVLTHFRVQIKVITWKVCVSPDLSAVPGARSVPKWSWHIQRKSLPFVLGKSFKISENCDLFLDLLDIIEGL